jgi:superfamily II DNA or RNA helicase
MAQSDWAPAGSPLLAGALSGLRVRSVVDVDTPIALADRVRLRFHAGTVVIEGEPRSSDVAHLPGMQWDPRVGMFRAPAYLWPRIRDALVRGGGRSPDGVRSTGRILDGWSAVELRPYQDAALLAWELAGRHGFVVLPTGSGKTRVAVAAMARTGLSTLCLVPTRVLLAQWHSAIAASWSGAVGQLGDGVRKIEHITVATFESACRNMATLGNRFDLLIIDEAHHLGSALREESLQMSVAAARLGLSATPVRGEQATERVVELIGPIVYELAIADLAGRFLAPFELVTLRVDLTADERVAYEARMAEFRIARDEFDRLVPGAPWQAFARHATRTPQGRRALLAFKEARCLIACSSGKRAAVGELLVRHRNARVLVFTADNDAAYAIAREHLIMPVTCDIGRAERDDALARFRRGELRALVSARVLNEGLDVPDADVAVIVAGTMGEREHVQRVGRVLRPANGKRALVYELVTPRTSEPAKAHRKRAALASRAAANPHP